jgi:hypothetical protein
MLICFFKGLNYLEPTSTVYNVHSYAEWLQTLSCVYAGCIQHRQKINVILLHANDNHTTLKKKKAFSDSSLPTTQPSHCAGRLGLLIKHNINYSAILSSFNNVVPRYLIVNTINSPVNKIKLADY